MADWPEIKEPTSLQERLKKGQLIADFEAGYVQSTAKWTRSRKIFEMTWSGMTDSDKETLESFFDSSLGSAFTWTHPLSGQTYTVMFAYDEFPARYVPLNHWRVELTLEEQ